MTRRILVISASLAALLLFLSLALTSCEAIFDTLIDEMSRAVESEFGSFDDVITTAEGDLTDEPVTTTEDDGETSPEEEPDTDPVTDKPVVTTEALTVTATPQTTKAVTTATTKAVTTSAKPANEIPTYVMPSENITDPIEREASKIIDGAISRAVAVVNVMKDDRHSNVSYHFVEDANGYTSSFNARQKKLYNDLISYARNFESFKIKSGDYGADVIEDVLTISKALMLNNPDIDSYFSASRSSY